MKALRVLCITFAIIFGLDAFSCLVNLFNPNRANSIGELLLFGILTFTLTALCIFGAKKAVGKPRQGGRKYIPDIPSPVRRSGRPILSADDEKASISAMESQLSHMLMESVTVRTQSVDEDENVKPPKGAEISYLDAKALKFWNGKKTDFEVPHYYADSAFGRNVGPALRRLLNGGYLDLAGIERSINLKTVPELKAILSERGLKTSGKKAELVNRLMSNLSNRELEYLFPAKVYEITPKGEHALDAYSIIFTNEDLGMGFPYYRLMKEKEATPSVEDIEIILRMLRQDLNTAQKTGDRETYRTKSMETGSLLKGLGRTEAAMEYYCLSFFLFWYRNTFDFKVNNIFAYEYDAKRIDECGKLCGYSLDKTLEVFQKSLKKHNPFGLCTSRNVAAAQQTFRKALSV